MQGDETMAKRKLILGSAASLILMSAAPVLAQSSDPVDAYATAKAQYESDLQAYNQKQQTYERDRSEYNANVAQYQRSLSAPLPRKMPDAPAVVVADPDPDVVIVDPDPDVVVVADNFADRLIMAVPPSALVRLESIPDVNYAFFNVPVLDMAGVPVGHFRRIETKDPGVLVAVVTLNGSRRTISMTTEHVRLDPDRRHVIADLTGREIALIPSGFPYG
jgi:hypothetical protein